MIKKMRFEIKPESYGEMGHLEFFYNDTALKVDLSKKTLTLNSGEVINITAKASSEYSSGWGAVQALNTTGAPAHSGTCWCSSSSGGQECFVELDFEPALPKGFADKMTFCCGQGHGSYPGTFTLFFIDEDGKSEQIGEPLYVDAHNGIFEWSRIYRCLRDKKTGLLYFKKPEMNA